MCNRTELKKDLPIELSDKVLHKEVKNLTGGHSFKISLDRFHNAWQHTPVADKRIS